MPTPSLSPRWHTRRGYALAVLCCVQFMLVLDETVVNIALPSIRQDLGFTTTGLTWVVNAYVLAFGGLLLLFGRAADLLGRRRLFLGGVALLAVSSLGCALAQEPWHLVAGRFGQGTGAAMTGPAALALITLLFPGRAERAKALALWGGIAGLGGTAGLVLSGALTGLASWRWVFLINLPMAGAALVLVPLLVAESRAERRGPLGAPGALAGTGALVSLVYGLLRAAESGWRDPGSAAALLLAAALAGAFVAAEGRSASPLVPRRFLADRGRAVANGTILLFAAAFLAASFLLTLHLQTVLGHSPLTAGLAFLPYGGSVLAGVAVSSRMALRFGTRAAVAAAFSIGAAGLLLLAVAVPHGGYLAGVLPGMLLAGFGSGIGFPVLTMLAVSGTTEEDAGVGSAVPTAAHQVGGAIGVAVLVGLAARRSAAAAEGGDPLYALTAGFSLAFGVSGAMLAVGGVLVAALLPRERR